MKDKFMTTAEAAKRLNVSQVTINRLIYKDVLKAEKFGPVWMVNEASVEVYLIANEGKAKNDPTRGRVA